MQYLQGTKFFFKPTFKAIIIISTMSMLSGCFNTYNGLKSDWYGQPVNRSGIIDNTKPQKLQPQKQVSQQGQVMSGTLPQNKSAYKVALILPTRSKVNNVKLTASSLYKAADLARREINNPNMSMMLYETDGSAFSAQDAAKKALTSGARIILGPLLSDEVKAAKQITEQSNVPMIAFSSDRTATNGGKTFLLSYLIDQDIQHIIGYAKENGINTVGILAPENAYGQAALISTRENAAKYGIQVTQAVMFNRTSPDYFNKLKKFTEFYEREGQGYKLPSWKAAILPVPTSELADVTTI
jgi:ABC-type branched-subunit amino acid transport system substrate-binding protein